MVNSKKQKRNISKFILRLFIALFSLLIVIISLITLASTVINKDDLAFTKYRFYIMRDPSHPQVARVGDLVIVEECKPKTISAGDTVVYGGKDYYYCDEVKEVKENNTIIRMIIAENNGIKYQFEESTVRGKVKCSIPGLGSLINFYRTPFGTVVYFITATLIIILLRILILRKHDVNNPNTHNNED